MAALLLFLPACMDRAPGTPSREAPEWSSVHGPPLSPRRGAHAFSVSGRLVIMGGTEADPCPRGADCSLPSVPPSRDGAVLDPTTDRWRRIDKAPVPLGASSSVVIGDAVFLWTFGSDWAPGSERVLLRYDAASDAWNHLPGPPVEDERSFALAAAGDRLVAYQTSHENGPEQDFMLDLAAKSWAPLPNDPLLPSFDRTMTGARDELVLIGIEIVAQPGAVKPSFYRAATMDLDTMRWEVLSESEIVGYDPSWFSVDGRVVNPTLGTSDGGQVNGWDRAYPHGGTFDPRSGTWGDLPDAPPAGSYPGVSLSGGDYVVSLMGAVLHVPTGSWSELPPPPRAAVDGQALTWTPRGLYVWSGVRWDGDDPELVSDAWLWEPAAPN